MHTRYRPRLRRCGCGRLLRCRGQVAGVAPVELEGVCNCIEIGPNRGEGWNHCDVSVLFIDCEGLSVLQLESK